MYEPYKEHFCAHSSCLSKVLQDLLVTATRLQLLAGASPQLSVRCGLCWQLRGAVHECERGRRWPWRALGLG